MGVLHPRVKPVTPRVMASLTWKKIHGVTQSEAETRIKGMVEDFAAQYPKLNIQVRWRPDGRGADAEGRGFQASFDVTDSSIDVRVKLSFIARPFKSKIETRMVSSLNTAFPEGPSVS